MIPPTPIERDRRRSFPRLTGAGYNSLIGAAILIVVGRVFGLLQAYAVGIVLVFVVAGSIIRALLWRPEVTITRALSPATPCVGDPARLQLSVVNGAKRVGAPTRLDEQLDHRRFMSAHLSPIAASSAVEVTAMVPTDSRGRITVGPTDVTLMDPFRIVRRSIATGGSDDYVIWPTIWPVDCDALAPEGNADSLEWTPAATQASEGEFSTLGEYVPGDDLRHIHWRSSARAGRLLVSRFEVPQPDLEWVVLDVVSDNSNAFEVAVSAAASIAYQLYRSGRLARFSITDGSGSAGPDTSNSRRLAYDSKIAGAVDLRGLLDALAEITPLIKHQPDMSVAQPPSEDLLDIAKQTGHQLIFVTSQAQAEARAQAGRQGPLTKPHSGRSELVSGYASVLSVPVFASPKAFTQADLQELVDGAVSGFPAATSKLVGGHLRVDQQLQ